CLLLRRLAPAYTNGPPIIRLSTAVLREGRTELLAGELGGMAYRLSPTAARLAGVAALLVAFGALLTAESGDLSRNEAGAIALAFGLLMIAVHIVVVRTRAGDGRPADASLAALAAALTVPAGLVALMWDPGIGNMS